MLRYTEINLVWPGRFRIAILSHRSPAGRGQSPIPNHRATGLQSGDIVRPHVRHDFVRLESAGLQTSFRSIPQNLRTEQRLHRDAHGGLVKQDRRWHHGLITVESGGSAVWKGKLSANRRTPKG